MIKIFVDDDNGNLDYRVNTFIKKYNIKDYKLNYSASPISIWNQHGNKDTKFTVLLDFVFNEESD